MPRTLLERDGSLSNDKSNKKMNKQAGACKKFNEDMTVNFNKISIKINECYFGICYCTCLVLNIGLTPCIITLE